MVNQLSGWSIAGYIVGFLFLLVGVSEIVQLKILAGIFFLVAGALITPIIYHNMYVTKKYNVHLSRGARVILALICLFLAGSSMGSVKTVNPTSAIASTCTEVGYVNVINNYRSPSESSVFVQPLGEAHASIFCDDTCKSKGYSHSQAIGALVTSGTYTGDYYLDTCDCKC